MDNDPSPSTSSAQLDNPPSSSLEMAPEIVAPSTSAIKLEVMALPDSKPISPAHTSSPECPQMAQNDERPFVKMEASDGDDTDPSIYTPPYHSQTSVSPSNTAETSTGMDYSSTAIEDELSSPMETDHTIGPHSASTSPTPTSSNTHACSTKQQKHTVDGGNTNTTPLSLPILKRVSKGKPFTLSAEKLSIKSPVANGKAKSKTQSSANNNNPKTGMTKTRGRPRRKEHTATVYQSQISENQIGIKLCIKKSTDTVVVAPAKISQQLSPAPSLPPSVKSGGLRKRSRKSKKRTLYDSDDSDAAGKQRRRERPINASTQPREEVDLSDQSPWASNVPENVLHMIFQHAVKMEGSVPSLVRFSRVCRFWRLVSSSSSLWTSVDLGTCTKNSHRTEPMLKWLIQNRLNGCIDLNITNWKVTNIQCVLDLLLATCPNLQSICLADWKGITQSQMMFLVTEFKKLQRLDLTNINMYKSPLAAQLMTEVLQTIGDRLTHLHLANNRMNGVPQVITALATYCPNLILLDLSNLATIAISHAVLHIEKLQHGCSKLKVLRITNAHMVLSTATLEEQMESPGFPELEEFSVAATVHESRLISDDCLQRILKTSSKLTLLDVRGCARLTHDSLIRLPTWNLKHLFLSGCSITRDSGSGLELITSKWAASLIEYDLAWANVQVSLDNALKVLAEKGDEAPMMHLNLCGSSVSLDTVKEVLANCPKIRSINLASCRGLPRGIKRNLQGSAELNELRKTLGVTLKNSSPIPMK